MDGQHVERDVRRLLPQRLWRVRAVHHRLPGPAVLLRGVHIQHAGQPRLRADLVRLDRLPDGHLDGRTVHRHHGPRQRL